MKISADRLMVFFTGLVAALLPFAFVTFTVDPVKMPAMAVIVVALFAFNLYQAFNQRGTQHQSTFPLPYLLAWLAFLVLNIASLFYTNNIFDNWYEVARILLWVLLLFAFRHLFSQYPNSFMVFCRGIVVAALVECSIGAYEIIQQCPQILRNADFTYMVMGTFGHKNLFSSGLMLFFPFCVYAFIKQRSVWRVLAFLASVLIVIDILIVQTRAAWVGLLFAATICFLLFLIMLLTGKSSASQLLKGRLGYYLLAGAIILVVCFRAIAHIQPNAYGNFYQRFLSTLNYNGPHTQSNETVRERFFLWSNTLKMWRDAPVFGWGTSSWMVTFPKYGVQNTRSEQGYIQFIRPHNDFLWRLAENGVVGLFVYLLIFLIPVYWLVKSLLSGKDPDPALSFLLLFGILSWIGNANFCFPSERNTHQFLLMALFAVSMGQAKHTSTFNAKRVAQLSILPLLPIALVTWLKLYGEYHSRLLYVARGQNNYVAMFQEGNKARSFVYQIDPVSAPVTWYQGVAQFYQHNYETALFYFKEADYIRPNHLPTLNNLGSAYQNTNQPHKAIDAYKRALMISPKFEEAIINLSAVYLSIDQTDSALVTISRCDINTSNKQYDKKLEAILQAKTQGLIDSPNLTPAEQEKAKAIKADYPLLKDIFRKSMDNHTDFISELRLQLKQ